MTKVLTLETSKYAIRLENFEGPLDLLCHLIEKNKMEIQEVNISKIAEQYIAYLNEMEELNLDIASEFILMASTLVYLKSKNLLPKETEEDGEITEEELLHRIVEYKKYKEISKRLREDYEIHSKKICKLPDKIELQDRKLEEEYSVTVISDIYKVLMKKMEIKVNKNSKNIEEIAVHEMVTITSKVRDIFRELFRKPKFKFNKMCTTNKYTKLETVTAFSGLLELSRKKKVQVTQNKSFGDITVEKMKKT